MSDYCKAALSEPPRVIGLRLRPYSLGHHTALRAYDSSFLGGEPKFADLILGAFICSQTWQGWHEWKESWKFPVFLKMWGWFAGKFDVPEEATKFRAYVEAGEQCPEVNIPDNARHLTGAWESRLKLFLIKEVGLGYEAAMDYPLALAWQDYCAHGEESGRIQLLSEGDKASLDFIRSERCKDLIRESHEAGRREMEEMKRRKN